MRLGSMFDTSDGLAMVHETITMMGRQVSFLFVFVVLVRWGNTKRRLYGRHIWGKGNNHDSMNDVILLKWMQIVDSCF